MPAFAHTPLEDGEVVLIGPVVFSSTSSVSFSAGNARGAQVSHTNRRTVGITNRRVIVEQDGQPGDTQIIANSDVKRVYVRRERAGSKVDKMETHRGQSVTLKLAGLGPMDEARLFEAFPHAEIGEAKGLFGGFSKITPRPMPAPPTLSAPKPLAKKGGTAQPRPGSATPPPAAVGPSRSHIDDPDITSLEDLRRCYPLPKEYDYEQTAEGDYVVKRLSDGSHFLFLLEDGMLGFDVPIQDPKRKKVTFEVFKRK